MPYPLPLTRTEAYLAYKAGVIQQSDLKPSLAVPRNGIDAWLAYWTGLAADYPKREDGTPHILQEEEAYIAYLCGVINEYPEKCLRRVGAYLRYLISARWGRPDHPLNREELYLSLIKTQFIPSGDPSSDIVIDGTAKAPFVDIKMYGDTFQQTYTGRNILPNNLQTQTINGVTFTRNADGSITIKGTASARTEPRLWKSSDGGSLVFASGKNYFNTTSMAIYYYADGFYTIPPNSASGAMPSDRNCDYAYIRVESGESIDTTIYPQIVEGSTAKDYEPYVGGTPSPSPEYPQQIQTVTGEQTVEIVGKNLLKLNDGATTLGGVPITTTNGTVNLNGTATSGAQGYYVTIGITASEPMVFSTNKSGATSGLDIKLQYKRDGTIYYPSVGSSFSLQAGDIIQQMYLMITNGSALDCSFSPMLEKGSTATAYAPYSKQTYTINLGSIELCRIEGKEQPLVFDYIYKDGDSWKVHKALGKQTIVGSDIQLNSSYSNVQFATVPKPSDSRMYGSYIAIFIYNDHAIYRYNSGGWNNSDLDHGVFTTPNQGSYWFGYPKGTSLETMQSELNGAITYYALSTPTDTVITNQALIDQLNALKQGGAEEGTTYIKVSATEPNLPGLLYVEAPKYE